jgi:hypothetical protein
MKLSLVTGLSLLSLNLSGCQNFPQAQPYIESISEFVEQTTEVKSKAIESVKTQPKKNLQATPLNNKKWSLNRGDTLHTAFKRWANETDTRLIYQLNVEYPIQAPITIYDTFEGAVAKVIASYQQMGKAITSEYFQGNRVLLVTKIKGATK